MRMEYEWGELFTQALVVFVNGLKGGISQLFRSMFTRLKWCP